VVTHGDKEMAKVTEDWENIDGEQPIIDLDEFDYDQFLLENPDIEEEEPDEENTESSKQLECYMNMQDPEPPQEELEKLALDCPNSSARNVVVLDASYEMRDEAHLHLLCQNDTLEVENKHLR
jgi:hypothetical protein